MFCCCVYFVSGLGGVTIVCWLRVGLGELVTLDWLLAWRLLYFSCCWLFVYLYFVWLFDVMIMAVFDWLC